MKNVIVLSKHAIFTLCLLFVLCITSYGQTLYNFTRVQQHEGLIMRRAHEPGIDPGMAVMNFHSDSDADGDHPDYLYMRATRETDEANPNNLVLTDKGLLVIGAFEDCGRFTTPAQNDGTQVSDDIKLYVNGKIAVKDGSATNIIISDQRFKKNITPLTNSLEVIRKSNFVEYQYNDLSGVSSKEKFYGILAQEMKKVLPSTVFTAKRKIRPTDKSASEFLMFNPNDLIYTGLNAIKELDDENQTLKHRVAELEKKAAESEALEQRVVELEKMLTKLVGGQDTGGITAPVSINDDIASSYLQQNTPNPLRYATDIEYSLPKDVSNAHIEVRDLNSKLVTRLDLNNSGTGKVTFNAKQYGIGSGTYLYSLIANEEIIESKKMIFIE